MNADDHARRKMNLIVAPPMEGLSVIKLIRTDTTLDLSQKAEKNGQHLGSPENELSQARARVECGFNARERPTSNTAQPKIHEERQSKQKRTEAFLVERQATASSSLLERCTMCLLRFAQRLREILKSVKA